MKNEKLKILIVSSLAISSLMLSNPSFAQPNKTDGFRQTSVVVNTHASACLRKANTYSPVGKCECVVRKVNRNGELGNYEVCNLSVKLTHTNHTLRTFQPSS